VAVANHMDSQALSNQQIFRNGMYINIGRSPVH